MTIVTIATVVGARITAAASWTVVSIAAVVNAGTRVAATQAVASAMLPASAAVTAAAAAATIIIFGNRFFFQSLARLIASASTRWRHDEGAKRVEQQLPKRAHPQRAQILPPKYPPAGRGGVLEPKWLRKKPFKNVATKPRFFF